MGHEHDFERIAALVEGRLEDPAPAEAEIAACSECRAHRDHLIVLAAVAALPSPALDDLERRRLRAGVWDQLTPPARVSSPRRGVPWAYRIASVAAAAVLVVGVGAVISDRSGDDAQVLTVDNLESARSGEASDATADMAEMQAAEEAPEIMSDSPPADEGAGVDDQLRVSSAEEVEAAADVFRRRAEEFEGSYFSLVAADCVAADRLAEQLPFLSAPGEVAGEAVEFVALGASDQVETVVVYRTDDCTVIHRE